MNINQTLSLAQSIDSLRSKAIRYTVYIRGRTKDGLPFEGELVGGDATRTRIEVNDRGKPGFIPVDAITLIEEFDPTKKAAKK